MRIQKLHIKNFRYIRSLEICDIENALILVGKNNVGKTAVLCALCAVGGQYEIAETDFNEKKQNIEINYLDLIPVRSEEFHWHKDIKGRVILDVENTGWFNKIAQTVFNKPQYTKVHLDAQGTFIWPLIDGKRTVTDIAALVKEEFGEAAEPLYPRIIKYFQIVESYHFIKFANMPSK